MAQLIILPTVSDPRGKLTIIEKILPFSVRRIYYIYGVLDPAVSRGGHRHKTTIQALVCIAGSCDIHIDDGNKKQTVILDTPDKCLVLAPEDWHTMDNFSSNAVLLVLASEYYDAADYIDNPYGD